MKWSHNEDGKGHMRGKIKCVKNEHLSNYFQENMISCYFTTHQNDRTSHCGTEPHVSYAYWFIFSCYSAQYDKAYDLTLPNVGKIPVYCHMSNDLGECGGGGWTQVMKIDGTKVRLGIASRPSFPCLQFLSDCFFFSLDIFVSLLTCCLVIASSHLQRPSKHR